MWFVVLVGASGIIAQVVLVRELLISYYGNELTIGILFASWMLLEAGAVFIAGKRSDRAQDKSFLILVTQFVFAIGFFASILAARLFKPAVGIMPGQGLGLWTIIASSFVILAPVAASHGALFGIACSVFSSKNDVQAGAVGRVYSWETVGTIIGGVLAGCVLVIYGEPLSIAVCVGLVNFVATVVFFVRLKAPARQRLWCGAAVVFFAALLVFLPLISESSLFLQFRGLTVVDYRNSAYGNIVLAETSHQMTLFYNGAPTLTLPDPDVTSQEEFGIIPLAFHPQPRKVLVIENGNGGLLEQVLKHPVERVDYLELDPALQAVLSAHADAQVKVLRLDPRLRIIQRDSRQYLTTTRELYDVILVGMTNTGDLVSNRLFTREFFTQAKARLNDQGIIAFRIPSSSTYISGTLAGLNTSIISAASGPFRFCRVIPGEYAIVIASDAGFIRSMGSEDIDHRIRERKLAVVALVPSYVAYLLDPSRWEWYLRQTAGAPLVTNRDSRPIAVFKTLLLWNRQMGIAGHRAFEGLTGVLAYVVAAFIVLAAVCVLMIQAARPARAKLTALVYAIATTGFAGMLLDLLLIFAFQVKFGVVYTTLGLLIAVYMSGIAAGSLTASRNPILISHAASVFLVPEAAFIVFGLAAATTGFISRIPATGAGLCGFACVLFFCGACVGVQFPLAAKLLGAQLTAGRTSGLLYAADLAGGCAASLLGALILIPLAGTDGCAVAVAALKVTSFAALWFAFFLKK